MNYRMITYILGWILLFEAAFLLVPLITALVFLETAVFAFLITIGICLLVSSALILKKPKNTVFFLQGSIKMPPQGLCSRRRIRHYFSFL